MSDLHSLIEKILREYPTTDDLRNNADFLRSRYGTIYYNLFLQRSIVLRDYKSGKSSVSHQEVKKATEKKQAKIRDKSNWTYKEKVSGRIVDRLAGTRYDHDD